MTEPDDSRARLVNVLLIALGCALILALVQQLTGDRIQRNESAAARAALRSLVDAPEILPDPLPDSSRPGTWSLCDGSRLQHSIAPGYAGPIALLYRFADVPARLTRALVLAHQETPGIVDFLEADSSWLRGLTGNTAASMTDIDTVTGATITSRAIRDHLTLALAEAEGGALPVGCRS